jgi:hypothetical protein
MKGDADKVTSLQRTGTSTSHFVFHSFLDVKELYTGNAKL